METRPVLRTAGHAKGADYTALRVWSVGILYFLPRLSSSLSFVRIPHLLRPHPTSPSSSSLFMSPSSLSLPVLHPDSFVTCFVLSHSIIYHTTQPPTSTIQSQSQSQSHINHTLHTPYSILHTHGHFPFNFRFCRISGSIYFILLLCTGHWDVGMFGRFLGLFGVSSFWRG